MSRRDLKVEIIVAGDGNTYPKKGNLVTINYTACLPDGTLFDSTKSRGKPFQFRVGFEEVITGLDMAVSQLSERERAKVTIPFSLAYGERGFPALVPARTDLIFDIELLGIEGTAK